MALLQSLRGKSPNAANLALTGGVALNSVLNGRVQREAGFEKVQCTGQ